MPRKSAEPKEKKQGGKKTGGKGTTAAPKDPSVYNKSRYVQEASAKVAAKDIDLQASVKTFAVRDIHSTGVQKLVKSMETTKQRTGSYFDDQFPVVLKIIPGGYALTL